MSFNLSEWALRNRQIVLFLMLGLLATPHALTPLIVPSLAIAAVLIDNAIH